MNEKKNARRKNKVYFYSSMPRVTQTLAVSFWVGQKEKKRKTK